MHEFDVTDLEAVPERIYAQAETQDIRITQHAHREMGEEAIALDKVLQAIAGGDILENHPEHRRGACCLLNGLSQISRPLHIVCTTARPAFIIITVYGPKPPKWMTATERR
jgi:hypothetical protein